MRRCGCFMCCAELAVRWAGVLTVAAGLVIAAAGIGLVLSTALVEIPG